MNAFLNTYLPWGIIACAFVICFYCNIIDTNRQRESDDKYVSVSKRKLELALVLGMIIGVMLCYSVVPIPVIWGIAIGAVCGLTVGLFKRKHSK